MSKFHQASANARRYMSTRDLYRIWKSRTSGNEDPQNLGTCSRITSIERVPIERLEYHRSTSSRIQESTKSSRNRGSMDLGSNREQDLHDGFVSSLAIGSNYLRLLRYTCDQLQPICLDRMLMRSDLCVRYR